MNTMEITKIVGALCGSLLILLLLQTGAHAIIGNGPQVGHYDHENAYVIEVEGAEEEAVIEVAEVPFADLYAVADAAAGERLYRACASCHKLEAGANAVGPYLHNVVGRDIGAAEGYSYSEAMAGVGDVWSPENLSAFLEAPATWLPGTKMSYRGMREGADRANLIAYLATQTN